MGSVHLESSLDPALGRQRSYSLSPRHWDIDHLESDRCDLSSPPSRGFIFAPDSFLYPPLYPSTEFTRRRRAQGGLFSFFPPSFSPPGGFSPAVGGLRVNFFLSFLFHVPLNTAF